VFKFLAKANKPEVKLEISQEDKTGVPEILPAQARIPNHLSVQPGNPFIHSGIIYGVSGDTAVLRAPHPHGANSSVGRAGSSVISELCVISFPPL
jgi:hypothetical protein